MSAEVPVDQTNSNTATVEDAATREKGTTVKGDIASKAFWNEPPKSPRLLSPMVEDQGDNESLPVWASGLSPSAIKAKEHSNF